MIRTSLWTVRHVGTANLPSYTPLIHFVNTFYAGLAVQQASEMADEAAQSLHQSHIRISLDIHR